MEQFKVIMELLGSVSLLFIGISLCVWGPMILKAIHRVERQNIKGWMENLEGWERHLDLELRKAKALSAHLQSLVPPESKSEPKDVN